MKLICLTANKETFHPIYFHDGINIIVGKQITPTNKNDGNTYNGVGKSLILHLIHFCLGARKISSFEEKIPDWEFTLNFIIDNKNYSCKRSTSKQNSIEFNGECLKPAILQEKLLKLCFGLTHTPQNMTLKLLESLLLNHVMPQAETKRLFFNLPGLMKLTTINSTDSEKDARNKLNCRIQLCKIVKLYYKHNPKHKNICEYPSDDPIQ